MSKYTCQRCLKDFKQESRYEKHLSRKTPCRDNRDKTKEIVNEVLEDMIKKVNIKENKETLLDILNKLLKQKSYSSISQNLNISIGTVKRWIELKRVPKQYTFDLMKLANIDIDYSKFNYKEKDQFFTPIEISKYCYSKFIDILNENGDSNIDYTYIEPSAGNGRFLTLLPKDKRIGMDIEPKSDEILKHDFLEWKHMINKKYVVIGNPPFGLRGQLALKFINHSSKFADYVCFILPQMFESDGKGVTRKRVKGLNLIHSENLNNDFESPNGKCINVKCIFQVWAKNHMNIKYTILPKKNKNINIYSLSYGETPSTTRNKKMLYKCDIYLPSTCFGKDNMKYYDNFDLLPGKKGYGIIFINNKKENLDKFRSINWSNIGFLSTNSAINIRTSQILNEFIN